MSISQVKNPSLWNPVAQVSKSSESSRDPVNADSLLWKAVSGGACTQSELPKMTSASRNAWWS